MNMPTVKTVSLTLQLLDKLFCDEAAEKVNVRLWDGTYWQAQKGGTATIVLKHPGALRAMFLPGTEVGLAEAYLYDDFDVEGNFEAIFGLTETLVKALGNWGEKLSIGRDLLRLPDSPRQRTARRGPARLHGRLHSIERDRQAITYHYDVSNDFYQLWLDRQMVYSCAYFNSLDEDLDTAQARKLDYICRKLRLVEGQRLLDVGCGWGGLAMHAAGQYGADVTGITLSQPQAELGNQRIAEAGLSRRSRILLRDYRQMNETQVYDALVSVGMFEHVGAAMLPAYFKLAFQLLRPGGVFLNHGIASNANQQARPGPSFSDTYVFPDGDLTPIHITLRAAEEAGFEVRDVESLREHYALTLHRWVCRLEERHAQALNFVDEPTYRVWRLFMSGSAYGFSTGSLNVYQALLVKPNETGQSGLPLTRADWYKPD
jgi:cyclopropane-fatty-acyl-phospholipid synthase